MKYLPIIFILIFSFSVSEPALGSSCVGYPAVCKAYSSADAVIIGKVKEIESETTET